MIRGGIPALTVLRHSEGPEGADRDVRAPQITLSRSRKFCATCMGRNKRMTRWVVVFPAFVRRSRRFKVRLCWEHLPEVCKLQLRREF